MTIQDAVFSANVTENPSDDYAVATTMSTLSTLTNTLAAQSEKLRTFILALRVKIQQKDIRVMPLGVIEMEKM